jgi:hypothetical protein
MRRELAVGFGIVPAIFLFCASLKASPLVKLQLVAPSECPGREAIESTLARWVRRPPAVPLPVNARFVPEGGRWVLYMTFESGQRVVAGDSCSALAEALVALIALAIDPTATPDLPASSGVGAAKDENAPGPDASPQPGSAPPAVMPVTSGTSATSGWRVYESASGTLGSVPQRHQENVHRWGLSLLMLTEVGSLPTWSLGPTLVGRYGSPMGWAELSASVLEPRFAAVDDAPTEGGRIGWFAAQLAFCRTPGETWPVAGCLGVESGDLFGYGVNTAQSNVGYALWAAATAGAVYRGQLRRDFGLELRFGMAVPALRPDFGVQGYGRIFQPGAVSLRFSVGFSWR